MSREHILYSYRCKEESMRQWIVHVTHSEEISSPKEDFFEKLRNGFILARVVRQFNTRLLPKVNEDPNLPAYQIRRNISFFIEACADFGVPRNALFTETELIENTNPPKIICTLELLIEKLIESKEGWVGPTFHEIFEKVSISKCISNDDPIMKSRNVETLLAQIKDVSNILNKIRGIDAGTWFRTNATRNNSNRKSINSSHRKKPEKRIEDIDLSSYLIFLPSLQLLQRLIRMRLACRLLFRTLKNEAYRENVANEILQTERVYVENLNVLINVYLLPLQKQQEDLVVDHIYSEAAIIMAFSSLLLQDLEPRIEAWNPMQRIGDVFLSITDYMKVYSQYVKDYSLLMESLASAMKSSNFKKIVAVIQTDPKTKQLPLESYLILPVQRIPRYEMLLRDLVRHTRQEHPDYANLINSQAKIQQVATYVNEKKREFDNLNRVFQLQKQFDSKESYAEPHRKFMGEFPVIKVPSKGKEYRIFLFNDILLLGKVGSRLNSTLSTKKKYKIKNKIDFMDITLTEDVAHPLHCRFKTDNFQFKFEMNNEKEKKDLISLTTSIQSELRNSRASRGIGTWKKNPNSDLISMLQNEANSLTPTSSGNNSNNNSNAIDEDSGIIKLQRKPSNPTDPRANFMRGLSGKLVGLSPKNVLEMVKQEEENADPSLRVLSAPSEPEIFSRKKKSSIPSNDLSDPSDPTSTLRKKKKRSKHSNSNSLEGTPEPSPTGGEKREKKSSGSRRHLRSSRVPKSGETELAVVVQDNSEDVEEIAEPTQIVTEIVVQAKTNNYTPPVPPRNKPPPPPVPLSRERSRSWLH